MSVYLQNIANKVINSLKGLIELVPLHSNQCKGGCNYLFVASTYSNINNPTFFLIFKFWGVLGMKREIEVTVLERVVRLQLFRNITDQLKMCYYKMKSRKLFATNSLMCYMK